MKNMRKRMLSLMVALMMCLSLVQPTAFAATTGEETEAAGTGDINIQTVVVEKNTSETPDTTPSTPPSSTDTPQAPSEATPPSGEGTTESQEPSGGEDTGDSSESEKPELVNPDGSINPDAVERPEQSDTVTVKPGGTPTEETDSDEDATPPAEETDPAEDVAPPAEETDPGEEDATPEEADPGAENATPPVKDESNKAETDSPWDVFYDEENDTYKLTFNIEEKAEGNQILDLTNALKLLNDYANHLKDNAGPSKTLYDRDTLKDLYDRYQEGEAYPQELLDIAKEANMNEDLLNKDFSWSLKYNQPLNSKLQAVLDKWNADVIASKLDLPNVLQPGDIRKFEISLTSDSKHVYKYKDGSFILATKDLENGTGTDQSSFDGTGFDGQHLTPEYLARPNTFTFSGHFEPLLNLFLEAGVPESEIKGSHSSIEDMLYYIKNDDKYGGEEAYQKILSGLGCTSEDNINADTITKYVLDYYNKKDGTDYTDLTKLFEMNSEALAELSSTSTNRPWTFGGDKLSVSLGSDYLYDNFYKNLLSFVYGDKVDIDEITGKLETDGYENDSWTDDGREAALYYYMAHKEIWKQTNQYFKQLLSEGLTAQDAIKFMMAVNIDGELTGNNWQDTVWPWYNSIELEQMDIDFSLTKKDGETGETITNSETGFQVYYIDKVTAEDGSVTSVNMYCSYDEDTQSYTFTSTPGTVWTQNGELKIDYAMMKDIVYYLQETVAPEGYEKDPNVYIVMNEDDYSKLSEEAKADIEGTFDKFLDLNVSSDGLSVSTDFVNIKIVTTPDRPTPPPTPDPDPDPDPEEPPVDVPDPDVPMVPPPEEPPEEPPVDIPEEDPPLVDIPEEEPPLVDVPDPDVPLAPRPSTPTKPVAPKPPVTTVEVEIPDEDVPLADVPNTGDGTGLWCVLGLMAGAGLAYLFLEEKKRQNNAQ